MRRGLLFDKDGTLFDFYRSWGPVTEEAALMAAGGDAKLADYLMRESGKDAASGRYRPDSPIAAGSNREIAEFWNRLLGRAADEAEALYARMSALFLARQREAATPVLDLALFFAGLKGVGFALGVATMDSEESARDAMARFGVAPHLDFICGFDSGHGAKPEPGMVAAFARHCDLEPMAIAVIGDSPHDMHMAKAAGVGRAIGVLTGVSPRSALLDAGADIVIADIGELSGVI